MGKGAVRRPSFCPRAQPQSGPFSSPFHRVCRASAGGVRACFVAESPAVHPFVSSFRASCCLLSPCTPPFPVFARTSLFMRLSVLPLLRVEPTTGCTFRRPAIREMNGHTPSGSRRLCPSSLLFYSVIAFGRALFRPEIFTFGREFRSKSAFLCIFSVDRFAPPRRSRPVFDKQLCMWTLLYLK